MAGTPSKGQKKPQIWMIQGGEARQVAYSKHQSGLFKKASELCSLCSVEAALVMLSPDGKAFSFDQPGVNTIMNNIAKSWQLDFDALHRAEAEQEANLLELSRQYSDLLEKLKAEKIRGEQLKQMRMQSQRQGKSLVDRPVDELNLEELLTLKSKMEEFKEKVKKRMLELPTKPPASTPTLAEETNASSSGTTEGDSSADPRDHDAGHEH